MYPFASEVFWSWRSLLSKTSTIRSLVYLSVISHLRRFCLDFDNWRRTYKALPFEDVVRPFFKLHALVVLIALIFSPEVPHPPLKLKSKSNFFEVEATGENH